MNTKPTATMEHSGTRRPALIGTPTGWVLSLAIAALGAYLLVYRTSHALLALPYLLLMACPLMHLFMHGGHGGHGRGHTGHQGEASERTPPQSSPPASRPPF